MPVVSVPTSFNIHLEFDAPGLGRRAVALFIDMFLQYLYIILIARFMSSVGNYLGNGFNEAALWLILLSPVFIYHIVMELTMNGQSVGKKIMKLRVVSKTGGRASLSQLLIRWLLRVSDLWIVILVFLLITITSSRSDLQSVLAVLFGMSFLITDIVLISNSKRAQRIGDILADTIVIKISSKESIGQTIFREVESNYTPMFPQVMQISDKDLNYVKKILDNHKGRQDILDDAALKIKTYLNIQTDMPAYAFLDKLLMDYNYLSAK